ncbi:hypothetical protein ACIBKY_25080 [Nonomuraea sp. NPDC050394]|uniref:hypothetical protein n=1 Tax=Nonomuraea sp. NPDC050394 TaxID=3364363 RepID=UPI0037BC6898
MATSATAAGADRIPGRPGALPGSWSYAYGTRDATRMLVQNVNGDWKYPVASFTKVLEAEFCAAGQP